MAKWAIIGMGFISPRHVKAIEESGGELVATCDIDDKAGARFHAAEVMLEHVPDITHVAICTPNHLHRQFIELCRRHNKIVLCEKPVTLSSKDLAELNSKGIMTEVYTVLQLRYHPLLARIKEENKSPKWGFMHVAVFRDAGYWRGWKGQVLQSGGIVFNLGIHYLDLLIQIFGPHFRVKRSFVTDKKCSAIIDFDGKEVFLLLEIQDHRNGQTRRLMVNGNEYVLSELDNLSFEGLHTKVYQELLAGRGLNANEALWAIILAETITKQ